MIFTTSSPVFAAPDSEIGIAKEVSIAPSIVPDGTVTLQYTIHVSNPNSFGVSNVQVVDDLSSVFAPLPTNIVSAAVTSPDFTVDFTGLGDTSLLSGTDTLAAGSSGTITIDVAVNPGGNPGPYDNSADLSGTSTCVISTGTTSGLFQRRWDISGSNNAPTSVSLAINFNNGLDANGFRQRTTPPTATGNTTADGAKLFDAINIDTEEIMQANGWVTSPCAASGSTWELRLPWDSRWERI